MLLALLAGPPALAQPSRVSVVLRWKAVADARSYELQIAQDRSFTEVVVGTRVPTPAYRWQQAPTAVHWWRVRSIDAEGREGPWSPPSTVQVDDLTPRPRAPADNAALPCGLPVAFDLEPSPSARGYVVELSRTPDFDSLEAQQRSPSPTVSVELGAGTWHWRARAVVGANEALSEPSPARSLTVRVGAARPKATTDAALGVTATLAWADVACARGWAIEVSSPSGRTSSLTSSSPSVAFKPEGLGDHRWRVAAVDELGVVGAWSTPGLLRVVLATPEPQPASEAPLQLRWAPVAGATSYRVELSTTRTFAQLVASEQTSATTSALATRSEGPEYWRVQARDARGRSSSFSAPREVQRTPSAPAPAREAPAPPRLTSPPAGAEVGSAMVEVTWEPSAGATAHELELDGAATQVSGMTHTLGPLADGVHVLRLRALGADSLASDWSPAQRFTVTSALASADVSAGEREVRLVLKDASGRTLTGRQPTLTVARGALGAPVERDGAYVAPWTPPADGHDVLRVEERGVVLELPVTRPSGSPLSLAVRAGWLSNFSSVSSPTATVGLAWQLPVLGRRLEVEARASVFSTQRTVDFAVEQASASVWAAPLSALLAWRQPLGPVRLRAGVGPALTLLALQLGGASEVVVSGGLEAAVGGGVRLGPGALELEVSFLWAPPVDSVLARLSSSGLAVRLGYAFEVGGR